MREMIERVARAIHRSLDEKDRWEDLGEYWRGVYEIEARAAIEAMREATEQMCEAGFLEANCHIFGYEGEGACFERDGALPTWQAMIDVALK